jgi:hypothetical protein
MRGSPTTQAFLYLAAAQAVARQWSREVSRLSDRYGMHPACGVSGIGSDSFPEPEKARLRRIAVHAAVLNARSRLVWRSSRRRAAGWRRMRESYRAIVGAPYYG